VEREHCGIAIVTAGTSELGEATARLLAARGDCVVIAGVEDDRGRALAAALGPRSRYVHAQPGSERDMRRLVADTLAREGRIDCLFNYSPLAGLPLGIAELPPEAWDAMLVVLLRGAYLGLHFTAGCMQRQGSGAIVCSAGGGPCGTGSHAAAAAGAAVLHLARSVALELAGSGVRVNCVCGLPGVPVRDLAAAALWLAGEEARAINGRLLVVEARPRVPSRASRFRHGDPLAGRPARRRR
jgi:NAD(P)-dependent dehydrogenase (short-subunit alcohol dehydrogenase family)